MLRHERRMLSNECCSRIYSRKVNWQKKKKKVYQQKGSPQNWEVCEAKQFGREECSHTDAKQAEIAHFRALPSAHKVSGVDFIFKDILAPLQS